MKWLIRKAQPMMERVISSFIDQIGYDDTTEELFVRFKSGSTYKYDNIAEDVYDEFMDAISKGFFFNMNIKNNILYPYEQVS